MKKDITLWSDQPPDKFLYAVTAQLPDEEQKSRWSLMKTLYHYFSLHDEDISFELPENMLISTITRALYCSPMMNNSCINSVLYLNNFVSDV